MYRVLHVCPVCGCELHDGDIATVCVPYNKEGGSGSNDNLALLPVCEDCHDDYVVGKVDLYLTSTCILLISKEGESDRTVPLHDCSHEPVMQCVYCGKEPHEIPEYKYAYEAESDYYASPADFVVKEDGTYNDKTNSFCCTACYIKHGMPDGRPNFRHHSATGYLMEC